MKKKNSEIFICESKLVHGNKYDYSLTNYVNNETKVKIICPIHGIFEQRPTKHLIGKQGCPICGKKNSGKSQMKLLDNFISEAQKIHGDKYDYSLVNYSGNKIKIKIICPIHGVFEQTPDNHLHGKGCKYCGKTAKMDTKLFIIKAKQIYGNDYDYSLAEYLNSQTKIKIICKTHGLFEETPNNFLSKKRGCPYCDTIRIFDTKSFIEKAVSIHADKFKYDKTQFNGLHKKCIITCKIHGDVITTPNYHLKYLGCPKCAKIKSKSENELSEFIESLNVKIERNSRKIISPQELDIFIPSHNLAIEFDGLYWHSELYVDKNYHLNKTIECEAKNIKLIHIFEDEWMFKKDIVKSRLKNILGLTTNKIYARKCEVKEVNSKLARQFLEDNHLQSYINSGINIALYYNNEIVSLMCFGSKRPILNNSNTELGFEMLRFVNKINYNVIGGASKLLKYFIRMYKPKEIISYADRRWSDGSLYETLGFELNGITPPSFFYVRDEQRKSRFKYQKHKLGELGLMVDKNLSSADNLLQSGYYRIFDCGNKKYKLII